MSTIVPEQNDTEDVSVRIQIIQSSLKNLYYYDEILNDDCDDEIIKGIRAKIIQEEKELQLYKDEYPEEFI